VHGEALGRARVRLADPFEHLLRDGGPPAHHRARVLELRLRALQPGHGFGLRGRAVAGVAGLGEGALEFGVVVLERFLRLLHRQVAATDEGLGVQLADAALLLDEAVHDRLRHRRVVALVVAAPAVAHQVDHDVLLELLAVGEREFTHAAHGLRVVAVDVEHRDLQALGHVRAVERGARVRGPRGEPDLVVDDDVDGAAGAVSPQLGEVQGLRHHALAGECRVAVDEHREDGEAAAAEVDPVLLRPDHTLEHAVDRLEVGRVGGQVDPGLLAVGRGERALGAQVVLHVSRALDAARVLVALELREDLRVALPGDVGEDIEPASMGHPDADLV